MTLITSSVRLALARLKWRHTLDRHRRDRSATSVRVVMRDGTSTEGYLPPMAWFEDSELGRGLEVFDLADAYFCPALNITSIEVWARSWLGLGPYGWRVWFRRRDA